MLATATMSAVALVATAGQMTAPSPQDDTASPAMASAAPLKYKAADNETAKPASSAIAPASVPAPTSGTDDASAPPEIVVQGKHLRGSVTGDVQPERILKPADVLAYGADTVDDLLKDLGRRLPVRASATTMAPSYC